MNYSGTKFNVSLPYEEVKELLKEKIEKKSKSTSLVGSYEDTNDDAKFIVLVWDKYYFRSNSRTSLTVIINNLGNKTQLCSIGSGGGTGLFDFDLGTSEEFEKIPEEILKDYII